MEKNHLEERCQELMTELEVVQGLRKKIEKSFQDENRVLSNKVQQLSQYIHEMETKNNEKLRNSLGADVNNLKI